MIRRSSLRVAKSTTAKPWKFESWTMISFVDPSGLRVKAIGRMPALKVSVHATVSVDVSMTLMVFVGIEPETAYLPSGVT